jgi:hypothetical protein
MGIWFGMYDYRQFIVKLGEKMNRGSELDYHELKEKGTFVNGVPYPNKSDFKAYHVYKNGTVLGFAVSKEKTNELAKIYDKLLLSEVFDKEGYDLARNEWQAENQRIHLLFQRTLFEEFGVANNPKREACFQLAWEHGHASGFEEVYNYFSEFVELIR